MIIFKNLPIHHVTDPEVRRFSKFEVNIGHVTIVKVIFVLVELVEQRIATEVQHTQGALLFDGWSCNDTHFVAVMISYCSTVHIREGDNINSNSEPRLALLALSPMAKVTANTNQTNEGEATTFNSETHIHFFKEVFHFYGLDFET